MKSDVRLTYLIHQTAAFTAKHFFLLVLATTLPLLVSYALVWLTLGATVLQVNATGSYEELMKLFSLSNPLTYTIFITLVIVMAINIVGWIAGPLLTIEQGNLKLVTLFKRSMQYFGSYFAMACMVIILGVLIEVGTFLVMTLILILVGLFSIDAIITVETYMVAVLPNLGLIALMIFLLFAPYFLIEQKLSAWQAILKSISLVKHHIVMVTVYFFMLVAVLILLGFILQWIPYVGGALAYIIDSILLTVFNYYLYKGLTATN